MSEMPIIYSEIVENKFVGTLEINIYQDIYAENPFEMWDTFGSLKTFENSWQYDSFIEDLSERKAVFVSCSTYNTEFILYVEREKILKEFKRKRMTQKLYKKALKLLNGEYEILRAWIDGEVYGFVVSCEGEEVAACWGFYGDTAYCIEAAKEDALAYRKPTPIWARNWRILPGLTPDMVGRPMEVYNRM